MKKDLQVMQKELERVRGELKENDVLSESLLEAAKTKNCDGESK